MKTCKHCDLRPVYLRVTLYEDDRDGLRGGVSYVTDIDPCIAPIVQALNTAGIPTAESCCGHGEHYGLIFLQDGRKLRIEPPD